MKPFLLGAATSAHQVEGNNIHSDFWKMEQLEHSSFAEPSLDAVDHYHHYEEDILLLKKAGCNAYRFSIEWARIEPKQGQYDDAAVSHYRKVLQFCHAQGITPIVTLHHFSTPAWVISKGGWGKKYVVRAFSSYAGFIAKELGDQLSYVCTINEANMGYQLQKVSQDMMKARKREGDVQVGVNLDIKTLLRGMLEQGSAFHCNPFAVNTFLSPRFLKKEEIVMAAHVAAKEAIKSAAPHCKVGLTLSLFDYQPVDGGEKNAEKLWQEDFGWYLPYFREDDFLGVQNYTRKIVDSKGAREPSPDAPVTQMGYEVYPQAIGHVLRKVAEQYRGELIVTENGIATADDTQRCAFINEAVAGVRNAKASGVPVTGYLHWSLLDNFEWQTGYSKTFGLISVDRKTQKRYPKESLTVLGSLATEMQWDFAYPFVNH